MRIAAFFIVEHEYIVYKPQVTNLGGKFIYDVVIQKDGAYVLSRKQNYSYIQDFFNITDSKISIENVSALVGQNGVGKSTLLDVIRKSFVEKTGALPYVDYFMLIENEKDELFFLSTKSRKLLFNDAGKLNEIKLVEKEFLQTIYYSPHLDFRFNPNFDEVDYFDISADNYLELDLEGISERGNQSNGMAYTIKQELLFKNSVRQIAFLASTLVTKRKIFSELFAFPEHGEAMLEFRDTVIDNNPRNVPRDFLKPFELVKDKIESELNDYTKVRKSNNKGQVTNQIEVNSYLLKRDILKYILSVVHRQMDVNNRYMSYSHFDEIAFIKDIGGQSALESFYSFFRNSLLLLQRRE